MALADDAKRAATQRQQNTGNDAAKAPYRETAPTTTVNAEPNWDGLTPGETGLADDGEVANESTWTALPDVDYTKSGIEPTPIGAPLAQAWQAVMAEVQEIRKADRFSGGGASYIYRGVDAVVNAVGPALRKHHVIILPIRMEPSYRDVNVGSKGTPMRECTMTVTYQIMGTRPDDIWVVIGVGESLDSGDKGTTKAGTVAFRNMLLTALAVPVDNPRLDADAQEYRRTTARQAVPTNLPTAQQLRDEALNPAVTIERLQTILNMIDYRPGMVGRHPELGQALVQNGVGDDEKLAALIYHRIQELAPAGPQ